MKMIPDATPVLHLAGARVSLHSLGMIAHLLEKHGSVMVGGAFVDEQLPVSTSLSNLMGQGDIATRVEELQSLSGPRT